MPRPSPHGLEQGHVMKRGMSVIARSGSDKAIPAKKQGLLRSAHNDTVA